MGYIIAIAVVLFLIIIIKGSIKKNKEEEEKKKAAEEAEERKQTEIQRRKKEEEEWQEGVKSGKINVKEAEIYYDIGTIKLKEGKYNGAIEQFNKALKFNLKHKDTYCNRGVAYKKIGDFDKAIEDYKNALLLDSNDIEVNINLGIAYMEKKQYDKAYDIFYMVSITPHNSEYSRSIAFLNRGIILVNTGGNHLTAIDCFVQALSNDPNNNDAIKLINETAQRYTVSQEKIRSVFNYYSVMYPNLKSY